MPGLYLPTQDAWIRWQTVGQSGPVVVWLPGIGFPAVGNFLATATQAVLPPLRSILIDPLGAGASDAASDPTLSIGDQADTVAAILDHLGHSNCILMGYSMGGAIAAELSLRRPDLVSRLILAEGNLRAGGGEGTQYLAELDTAQFRAERLPEMLNGLHQGALAGDSIDSFILGSWRKCDPGSLHGMARALVALRPALAQEIYDLTFPRFYIFGGKSLADPEAFEKTNLPSPDDLTAAGIKVEILASTGHDLMLSDPKGFAALIAPMLSP